MSLEPEIIDIIKQNKVIAVVGASRNPNKAAHAIPAYLKKQGYKIIPVNPSGETILDEKTYTTLIDIPEKVDIIDIFRPSEETPEIVEVAVKLQPKLIWLQLGIANEEAKKIAESQGVKFVQNKCLKVEHMRMIDY